MYAFLCCLQSPVAHSLGQAVDRACVRSGSAAASVLPTKASRGGMCNSKLTPCLSEGLSRAKYPFAS